MLKGDKLIWPEQDEFKGNFCLLFFCSTSYLTFFSGDCVTRCIKTVRMERADVWAGSSRRGAVGESASNAQEIQRMAQHSLISTLTSMMQLSESLSTAKRFGRNVNMQQ